MSLRLRTALVTGGGGFVGKAIVKRLLTMGVETRVLGRHRYAEIEQLGGQCIVGDICDAAAVERAAKDVDIVFHVAALAGIWGKLNTYHLTNVRGTKNIVDGCRKNDVPMLVYTSTPSVVFNGNDIRDGDERLGYPTTFLCNYAQTKATAERLVLAAHSKTLATCALRPHLIWGPGDPHLIPRLLDRGRMQQLKQVGAGNNMVDISYIDNVAHAHILAAVNLSTTGTAGGKPYFISQGEPVNLWSWVGELFSAMDLPPVNSSVSFPLAYWLGGAMEIIYNLFAIKKEPKMTRFLAEQLAKSHYFSINNARKDLGYEPIVSTESGMKRTVEWLKKT
ncbi:MAG: NAD-dependent epimerase/dehydratase family protein [Desulforhopalus sp.]